ncbi:haloacid dehalogenase [Thiocystis violacea]|uniref:haloacid dehalogenase n=1 Tax=Thiocystis violacea TaxID=13725 RepID=UPI0019032FB5|nr:haloacid dehalogenase [Thiocystis violacea]
MRQLVFLDLDDTLFQSRRKCPSDSDLHPTAYLGDGRAHSFMTAKQRTFWRLLDDQATLIPTTARDHDSLRRVDLPFRSWRIIDYGGIILDPDGKIDGVWMERMTEASRESIGGLTELLDLAETFIVHQGLAAHVRIIEDFGLPFYLVAKYRDGREADLDRLQRELMRPWVEARPDTHRLHRNGNNLAAIPRRIGKEQAVRYLIERLGRDWGDLLTIGIGDSLIDGAFMAECDYSITPRGSQLFEETLRRVRL